MTLTDPDAPTVDYWTPRRPRATWMRRLAFAAVLMLGVQVWLLGDSRLVRTPGTLAVLGALLLAGFVPAIQSAVLRVGAFLERRGRVATPLRFLLVSLAAGLAFYGTARWFGRPFTPRVHDEFSYLLQSRMFAEGRLWLGPHALPEFFDTFYVIVDRAYASQYFPGAALMFAPGLALGLPFWAMPLVVASLAVGAIFLLLRELYGGAVAASGAVAAVGVLPLRYLSISLFAQTPTMLLATLGIWCALRWDDTRRRGFLVGVGVAFGWCAITRPLDALAVAGCVAAFVAWRLRRSAFREWRRAGLAAVLPMLPFLALQLTINRGVTGHWLQTPFAYYADRDMPGSSIGFHEVDPSRRPVTQVAQKVRFYDERVVPEVRKHTPAQIGTHLREVVLPNLAAEPFADGLMLLLLPASLLALRDARRTMVIATFPVWTAAYLLYPFTFTHYFVVLVPAALAMVYGGADAIARRCPSRLRAGVRVAGVLLPAAAAVLAMPQFRRDVLDQMVMNPIERRLRDTLATLPAGRKLLVVRYDPSASTEDEVVFNVERAAIDDNPTVRAHDLGDARNVALYRYYAGRQPDRVVYRFDRGTGEVTRLGDVVSLSAGATTRP